jgi:hypothetical protein
MLVILGVKKPYRNRAKGHSAMSKMILTLN